ncbi:hypothetical protein BMS3Bbin10_01405 [bacterium BMS3Bbin10]|nr:hypothetical protein BMS3Bbin10_01405 [bacterium BMS3Bbin10]
MVLDALRIDSRRFGINADIRQESLDNRVPLAALTGEFAPGVAQKDAAIGLALDEARFGQPGERARHRRLRDAEARGDIDLPRLAGGLNQIVDQLHIILEYFVAPRRARLPEGRGLSGGFGKRRTPF